MAITTNTVDPGLMNTLNGTQQSSSRSTEMQDRFLMLLTTQLKNQDPLNPLDNAQMTSQLAQITTVDGIERLNKTMAAMMSTSAEQQTLQAAALVGHGALVEGKSMILTKEGAIGGYELGSSADKVKIEIRDKNGAVVRTMSESAKEGGVHNFVWDGKNDQGETVPEGNYTFGVVATQGKSNVSASTLNFGYISGVVRNGNGALGIDVGTYGRFSLTELKQII